MTVRFQIVRQGARLPVYATEGSAGCDLCACIEQDLVLKLMERMLVPTGLAMALPQGVEAQVRPRSGLAIKKGITVLNAPGTIDSDYRGEVQVILINLGREDFLIKPGDRIAQMVICRYDQPSFQVCESLDATKRGGKGFGSTGV